MNNGGLAGCKAVEQARQPGLFPGGIVFMDHAFGGRLIDLADGRDEPALGQFAIAALDGLFKAARSGLDDAFHARLRAVLFKVCRILFSADLVTGKSVYLLSFKH